MARFIFKLDPVLEHRQNVERQRQRAVAEIQATMTVYQTELDALDKSAQESVEDVRRHRLTGVLDMSFLAAHRRFLNSTHKRALEIAQQMAKIQLRLDAARRELAEAAKQRKIIEKLKERQFDRWRSDQNRRELASTDEVGMQIAFANLESTSSGVASLATSPEET